MNTKPLTRLILFTTILVSILAITVVAALAQESCDTLLDLALQEVGDACGGMDRNSACYGYTLVNATFAEEQREDFFSNPADRTTLRLLDTIKTASLSVEHEQWGIAVLNVQANIPNTLPGQAVTFVLLGDVEVENAVDPDEAFTPVDPVAVITNQPANMRSGPGLLYNVIGSVGEAVELQADGFSEDGAWLRVVYGSVPAWVYRDLVETELSLDGLPTLSPQTRMPMQAFYLRTGIGESQCQQAPEDVLMIQGPDNLLVDLTVNGADISIGSTILIRIIPPGDTMEITVIDGHAEIGDVTVYPGWKTTLCLSEPGNRGVDGNANDRVVTCGPSEPVPLNPDEVQGWCILGDFPEFPINYEVPINCEDGIENPYIPPPPPGPNDPIGTIRQCSALVIGGPTGVMEAVDNTFWWYGVDDATHYVLTVYDGAGNQTDAREIGAPTTWIDLGGFPANTTFSWTVEAFYNDQLLCGARSSGSVELVPPREPPPPPATLSASWECDYLNASVVVNWSGAQPGDILTIELVDGEMGILTQTVSGASGSTVFANVYDILGGSVTGSPSGESVSLPALGYCDIPA